jgi:hypothetical protein
MHGMRKAMSAGGGAGWIETFLGSVSASQNAKLRGPKGEQKTFGHFIHHVTFCTLAGDQGGVELYTSKLKNLWWVHPPLVPLYQA